MKQIKVEVLNITPEMAQKWLCANLQNRTISKKTVQAYSNEMSSGRWVLTNQGIAFYDNGILADGQHRLLAIVNSGKTIPMIVTRGLSYDAIIGIDQHRVRSVRDTVNMTSGYKFSLTDFASIRLCYGLDKATASMLDAIAPYVSYEIEKVNSWFKRVNSKLHNAPVKSAIILAYFSGVSEDTLSRFVNVLCSGIPSNEYDVIVLKLREKLLTESSTKSSTDRNNIIKVVQWCIKKYDEKENISRIITPKDFIYKRLQFKK